MTHSFPTRCSSDRKVSAGQPQSPVLDRRIASRLRYVREGWHRPITNKERREYRAEANAALIRAGQFEVRAEQGATAFAALGAVEKDRKTGVQGKSVSVRVDLGGRRIIKKTINEELNSEYGAPEGRG